MPQSGYVTVIFQRRSLIITVSPTAHHTGKLVKKNSYFLFAIIPAILFKINGSYVSLPAIIYSKLGRRHGNAGLVCYI